MIFIAYLVSLPFVLMKAYCQLAERSVSFFLFRTVEQMILLKLLSCVAYLQ